MTKFSWERLARKTIFKSPYITVWQDAVRLPNGSSTDDYSVVGLPDGVLVVATDEHDNAIMFREYKYAVDDTVLTFPAGGLDSEEDPVTAAARELLEETGYQSTELEVLTKKLYSYPSKSTHGDYVVRAKNAKKVVDAQHEESETISDIMLIPVSDLGKMTRAGEFNTSYIVAAIALAFPENP